MVSHRQLGALWGFLFVGWSTGSVAQTQVTDWEQDTFYQRVMMSSALMPANLTNTSMACPVRRLSKKQSQRFRSATEVNYGLSGWQQRVASNWQALPVSSTEGRVLIIDSGREVKSADMVFRYMANANSHQSLYEPWSSSKVMAITAAIRTLRLHGLTSQSRINRLFFPDLVTAIHTYLPFGSANGDSNAIASYLVNLSGRAQLASLFGDGWLLMDDARIGLRGAYNAVPLDPSSRVWQDQSRARSIDVFKAHSDDPLYQNYRCDSCGTLGNKPMTTLAQAEWLKRLATHGRVADTRLPGVSDSDVEVLFWGKGHSDSSAHVGGMMQGIGQLLPMALVLATGNSAGSAEQIKGHLDSISDGQWRVYHKVGWGYSETRSASEVVMLAHVCLPEYQGGREFTLAAQVSLPSDSEASLPSAGRQIVGVMTKALRALFSEP